MGEKTGITWTDHTFNPWSFSVVQAGVAGVAKGDAVVDVKPQLRKVRERLDMVGAKIAASIVTALLTGEFVARKYIETPPLVIPTEPLTPPFFKHAVFVRVARFASRRALTGYFTDFLTCFQGVLHPSSITWTFFGSLAHFAPRFFAHLLAFHRRNEGLSSLNPSEFQLLALGEFLVRIGHTPLYLQSWKRSL